MQVAIIGAGLAGLSCAIVLEKNGIIPVVYEKTNFIGDREAHVGASLKIVDRPVKDITKYLKKSFDIDVKPLNTITKLTHYAPAATTSISGSFGLFFRRDKEETSLKGQLFSQLQKTEIQFNMDVDYKVISKEFDYVVLADGKPDMSEKLGCWTDWVRGIIKGAVLEGNFDPQELIMWLNKTYCKAGYAYLTPFSDRRASISLYVPDISIDEIDYYWDLFLKDLHFKYEIVETFKVRHGSGHVYPHKVDNILLAGSVGGAIDPFLGFGIVKSITMGGLAAKSIIEGSDYEKLVKNIYKQSLRLYEIRESFNMASNENYDTMVKLIGIPGVKPMLYDVPINVLKLGNVGLKLKRKIKGERL
ncbi:MAG TPA: NAD(P)/FAD-dependent oxidoreductase [Clostridia bacterium]|nr:NAD(P)/FAD-dependent oxidoreductase [Clostridia bacterium]